MMVVPRSSIVVGTVTVVTSPAPGVVGIVGIITVSAAPGRTRVAGTATVV